MKKCSHTFSVSLYLKENWKMLRKRLTNKQANSIKLITNKISIKSLLLFVEINKRLWLELESDSHSPAFVVVDDDQSCSPAKKRCVLDEESAASKTTTNSANLYVSARQGNFTDEDRVCLQSLKDKLVSFNFIGPLSSSVLGNVLRPVTSKQE